MNTVKFESKQVKVVAHRGLSGLERENTYPAFVAAGNRSYFGIETDIHVTKDGKFVVIHDASTERVSLGEYDINVEENDYCALENIVLPDKDGSKTRQDIRIPLLKDYISICKKYNKICVLEIKGGFSVENLKKVICEFYSYNYLDSVIFISFNLNNCTNLRNLLPNAKIQYLTDSEVTDELIGFLVTNKLDLDIHWSVLSKSVVDRLHQNGIEVNCWTCDDKGSAEELVSMGVDYITSNILE